MLKYICDSNIISEPSKPCPNNKVVEKLLQQRNEIALTTISYFEMLHGILILPNGKRREHLMAYLEDTIMPFYSFLSYDYDAARMNAKINAKLELVGNPLPILDSQIAAIALVHDLILVTRNTKDFMPIQEYFPLQIENWFL